MIFLVIVVIVVLLFLVLYYFRLHNVALSLAQEVLGQFMDKEKARELLGEILFGPEMKSYVAEQITPDKLKEQLKDFLFNKYGASKVFAAL